MITDSRAATPAAFVAALRAGQPIRAIGIASAMMEKNVALGQQWQSVGRFAANECEWPLAIAAFERFVADDPSALDRQLALANIQMEAGRVSDALGVLGPLLQIAPNDARLRHFLGIALIESGDSGGGIEHLRAALKLRPDSGFTWLALANARRFTEGDAEFVSLRDAKVSSADQPSWFYALGKAFDDLGDHEQAFSAFEAGAQLVARERPFDTQADRASAWATIQGLAADMCGERQGREEAPRAIFVTGKPRSGTTLVEQILGGHSAVGAGGEINILGRAVDAGDADFARSQRRMSEADRRLTIKARYEQLLDRRFGEGTERVIDKSLNTSRYAQSLRCVLPNAPVIWVRRDPLDTAWSSFRTFFARGLGWSFDLVAMAQFHAVEDKLHAFWADHYGAKLMTLSYADLIDAPDATVAKISHHCGLPYEAGVTNFHQSKRIVQTASVDQVRRPINRDGLGTAVPYHAHLAPYRIAYDKARRELGLPPC